MAVSGGMFGKQQSAPARYLCGMRWMESRVLRHIIFWLVYLLVMGFIGGRYDMQFDRAYIHESMELPLRMLLVYAVLARTPILGKGNWWRWLAEMLGLLVLATLAGRLLMYFAIFPLLYKSDYSMNFWDEYRLIYFFLDLSLTLFLVLSLRFARQYMDFASQKQQLLLEKTTAELHALRNQTNPHFLFNTLTSIYTLARKNAPETAEVVMRLSKLLRFILYECNTETIPLRHELQIIEEYIALEKMRFGKRITVNTKVETDDLEAQIAPMLLLPLYENAFKHGAGESRFDFLLESSLVLKNNLLAFHISNSKEQSAEPAHENGIGLKNLKKQLELLYPGRHTLAIATTGERFDVHLSIQMI